MLLFLKISSLIVVVTSRSDYDEPYPEPYPQRYPQQYQYDWSAKENYDPFYIDETIFQHSNKCRIHLGEWLDFYAERMDEYRERPGMLTLFRKGEERFYCETSCPLGMKAGCNETSDGSMEITDDCPKMIGDYSNLPSSYCHPPLSMAYKDNYGQLDFSNSKLHYTHIENPPITSKMLEFGVGCSESVKCPEEYFCSEVYNIRTQSRDKSKIYDKSPMVCVKYPTEGSEKYGALVPCESDIDCSKPGIIAKCRHSPLNITDSDEKIWEKVCEFEYGESSCRIGKLMVPETLCSDSTTCQEYGWCDMDAGLCCTESPETAYELHYCPDGVTPIQQEPNCTKNEDDEEVCMLLAKDGSTKQQGICWSGKCCPELQKKSEDKYEVGDLSYQSAMHCDPEFELPFKYAYKWCHGTNKKINTIGTHDFEHKNVRSARQNCRINSDCALKSQICLNLVNKRRVCYFNPEKQPETASRYLFYGKLIGPIFMIIVVAIAVEICL